MTTSSREAILTAATRTAMAHGYGGLNFRTLADDVGIRAPSIYHYFPSKADLGAAVAKRYWEDNAADLETISDRSPDPTSALRRYPRDLPQVAAERKPHVPVQLHGCRI